MRHSLSLSSSPLVLSKTNKHTLLHGAQYARHFVHNKLNFMRLKFSTKIFLKMIIRFIAWSSTTWQEDILSVYIKIILYKGIFLQNILILLQDVKDEVESLPCPQ